MSNIEAAFATEMGQLSLPLSRKDFMEEVVFKVGLEGVPEFGRWR